jgi:hypothetical protein
MRQLLNDGVVLGRNNGTDLEGVNFQERVVDELIDRRAIPSSDHYCAILQGLIRERLFACGTRLLALFAETEADFYGHERFGMSVLTDIDRRLQAIPEHVELFRATVQRFRHVRRLPSICYLAKRCGAEWFALVQDPNEEQQDADDEDLAAMAEPIQFPSAAIPTMEPSAGN